MSRSQLTRLARSGRIVIKIGSGVLTDDQGRLEPRTMRRLAAEIAPLAGLRRFPVVVSSGAIAVGMGILGLKTRPRTMAGLQAAAAVGQGKLVEAWAQAFRKHDLTAAQVLLTHADLAHRHRFLNARRALGELLRRRAVPVINENDTVSVEEIAFGDNDMLAAQVSNLVDGVLLVMLSVADGVRRPDGTRVDEVLATDPLLDEIARPSASRFGKGGMISKLRAARIAAARGAHVAIVPGKRAGAIAALLEGEDVGTVLVPDDERGRLRSRAHWIAHTLRPAGTVRVDAGAARALRADKSLLPSGITAVTGEFLEGDPVDIAVEGADAPPLARGLVRYSAEQLQQILGRPSSAIADILGFTLGDAAIHKDDLVLLDR
jgi:glutamate 5-kinase